jgi:hypothetical protein
VRKTPPGRAVIVAGGFGSGPIGVLPARPPTTGPSSAFPVVLRAARQFMSTLSGLPTVAGRSEPMSPRGPSSRLHIPQFSKTCSKRSQSDVKPSPRSDLVVRHTVTACKGDPCRRRRNGAIRQRNATRLAYHDPRITFRDRQPRPVWMIPVATWLRSPAMMKRAVPQAKLRNHSVPCRARV